MARTLSGRAASSPMFKLDNDLVKALIEDDDDEAGIRLIDQL